ncbi:MAG: outer membrane protein [Steroidobacteraceae bacterium]|jgi:outer membrane immunogenic protein
MRRLLVAVGLMGLLSPAFAADYQLPILGGPVPTLPVSSTPTYVVGPPPIRVFTWTGCYVGGHAGGASADNQFNGQFSDPVIPIGVNSSHDGGPAAALAAAGYPAGYPVGAAAPFGKGFISSNSLNVGNGAGSNPLLPGVLGGAQAGCDVQFAEHWVVGFSADATGANIAGSTAQTNSFGLIGPLPITTSVNSSGSLNAQTNFIATFTGRFGYSMGAWPGLIYVKGGGAYEQSSYSFSGNVASTSCNALTQIVPPIPVPIPTPSCALSNPTFNQQFNFGTTDSRFGWTIGIGTEWMVYGGWSMFFEYNYLDFGTRSVTFSDPNLGSNNFSVTKQFNVFTLGVNYRFGVVEGDHYRNIE